MNQEYTIEEKIEIILAALSEIGVAEDIIAGLKAKIATNGLDSIAEELEVLLKNLENKEIAQDTAEEKSYQQKLEEVDVEELGSDVDFDKFYDERYGTEAEAEMLDNIENDEVIRKIEEIYERVTKQLQDYQQSKEQEKIEDIRKNLQGN